MAPVESAFLYMMSSLLNRFIYVGQFLADDCMHYYFARPWSDFQSFDVEVSLRLKLLGCLCLLKKNYWPGWIYSQGIIRWSMDASFFFLFLIGWGRINSWKPLIISFSLPKIVKRSKENKAKSMSQDVENWVLLQYRKEEN